MSHSQSSVVADLNDLLQLDHDAVNAYTLAIDTLRSDTYRELLASYRGDHKRHIEQLSTLIRERGGVPIEAPHAHSPLKMAVQGAGSVAGRLGGDHFILLAFKAVEGQTRDRYRSYASRVYEEEVSAVVKQAAEDEEKHYRWATDTLRDLGYGEGTLTGQMASFVEGLNRIIANPVERAGRMLDEIFEDVRPRRT